MSIIKLNNRSVKDVTAFGSITSLGSLTHIATQTASSSASVSFTSGIDSTYNEYIFYFVNIHIAGDSDDFGWQVNTASQTGYNETVTSSAFATYHQESGGSIAVAYNVGSDQAQGTGIIQLTQNQGNSADDNAGGFLHLFNPSQTNHVKHFISSCAYNHATVTPATLNLYAGGYVNSTSAIDDIKFYTRSGGNIDSGQILLFGLS